MAHLLRFRKGWENERLAAYLLSRLSFVAHPSSVADDLGSDFFCTLFEIRDQAGADALLPGASFAIQIKSSPDQLDVSNKIEYLSHLELPFFAGTVQQPSGALTIYSAEFLPLMFSLKGIPTRLRLDLVPPSHATPDAYCDERADRDLVLRCPEILTLSQCDDRSSLSAKAAALSGLCSRVQANIAARRSEEHIYDTDGCGRVQIMAGPGSTQHFRDNVLKRLAEVFYNLRWLLDARPSEFALDEFRAYERLYLDLERLYPKLPDILTNVYRDLKVTIERST